MQIFVGKTPCDNCPFTKDIGLKPGRLKEVMKDTDKRGAPFICHKSIYESKVDTGRRGTSEDGEEEDFNSSRQKMDFDQHVICRGFVNARKGDGGQMYQLAQRLGCLKEVDDPTNPS